MIFKDIVMSINESEFAAHIKNDNEDFMVYKAIEILRKLKNMEPVIQENPLEILVMKGYPGLGELEYFLECIEYISPMTTIPNSYEELEEHVKRYDASMTPWNKVLGYSVNNMSITELGTFNIFLAVLDEITEMGLDEDTISDKREEIWAAIMEAEKDIADGRVYECNFKDTRTEEEKQKSYAEMTRKMEYNMREYFKYLHR